MRKFLVEDDVRWNHLATCYKAFVTAIYFVSGGLTYTGNDVSDTSGGVQLNPNAAADVPDNAGWKQKTTTTQEIIQSVADQHDWIIAIEYEKIEIERREEGTGNGRGSVAT